MISANVEIHGTFLTGNPLPMIDDFVTEATWVVGAQGLADWHQKLDQRLQDPTPFYETQLMVERQSPEIVWAHDRGIIYGPWLEGTSSRNRTTKFKGYTSKRQTEQELQRKVPTIVQPYVEQLIRRLDGA
jgi:hypothetical protein